MGELIVEITGRLLAKSKKNDNEISFYTTICIMHG
jgi:hypothetical protein